MIDYTTGDIFTSRCHAIVNPVNCVGVMGAGLALQFKRRFPDNFASYADACRAGTIAPGRMHVFDTGAEHPRFIVNFPTKRHWRDASRLDDIAQGMDALNAAISEHRIRSIAIPPLGSGLGGLAWDEVRPLIANRLTHRDDLEVIVFEPHRSMTNTELQDDPTAQAALSTQPPSPLLWAGIGARNTPPSVLQDMTALSRSLAEAGWHLSSGGAHGADSAFASGTPPGQRTVWLPWPGYNDLSGPDCHVPSRERMQQCLAIAARLHPAWNKCSQGVRKLHARNLAILLGPNLDRPVDAVVCFTENGAISGGTGMGLRIAAEHGIPVFNLGAMTMQAAWSGLQQLRQTRATAEPRLANGADNLASIDPKSMARVLHLRNAPPDAIRIDRRTQWGNPFIIGPDGTREDVIAKFRDDLWKRIRAGDINLTELASLHGKDLACHCAPLPCHGDALAEAAAWVVANKHQTTATEQGEKAAPLPPTASLQTSARTYRADEACVFRFTKADWGVFSNFAPLPNPISAAEHTWPTSEHLYQAAKFRLSPHIQQQIATAVSARDATKLGRNRNNTPDADWMSRRMDAMRWVIRMKREANTDLVDSILERTADRPIVEYSGHDAFWGAKPDGATLVGRNVLGRLWMELRQHVRDGDPRAQAAAWDNPLTPVTVASTDPAHDERNRINQTYRTLLAASNNDPHLIPYRDDFDEFRSVVSGAIETERQPPQYLEKLRELDQRLQADIERKETLTAIQTDTIDLNAQLSWLNRTAKASETASIADLPEYAAFVHDTADCLDRWRAFQAHPETRPHIEHFNDPVLDTRVTLLSLHVPAPEPAITPTTGDRHNISSPSQHPIVREYVALLEQAQNKPELLAYQPAFHDFRETVQRAKDDPDQHPDMAKALGRLSTQLERSHEARATVASLRRRLTETANEALDIESWAAEQSGKTVQDSPRYDAWRTNADALVDEYRSMARDSSLAPHVNDRDEARQFLQRRIAFLSDDRFARIPALQASEEEALHMARAEDLDHGMSM